MAYLRRIVEGELKDRLGSTGAIVIEGPKASGKTETARQFAASEVLLDIDDNALRAVDVDPGLVLAGKTPRLIDEWQLAPAIWNHIRRAVDDRKKPGQFILTGSAVPPDDITRHTGAGRLTRVRMRPMSLFETGHSTGEISLAGILDGDSFSSQDPGMDVSDLAERLAVGGWPGTTRLSVRNAIRQTRDYLDEIRRMDVGRVNGTDHDPEKVGRLLRSLARNTGTYAALTTLVSDTGEDEAGMARPTAISYVESLRRLMIVEDQPAWAPHLRSKSRIRSTEKRFFVDPSLAVAALRASPDKLLEDLNFMGHLFESLVVRDLRVYAQATEAAVLQYRDNTGLEVDAVVEAADGRWAAFEVKLGSAAIDEAAENLQKFYARTDTNKCGEPAALVVVTATGFGYVRKDGVHVVPIGALGP